MVNKDQRQTIEDIAHMEALLSDNSGFDGSWGHLLLHGLKGVQDGQSDH
jgi:hypothetical protein